MTQRLTRADTLLFTLQPTRLSPSAAPIGRGRISQIKLDFRHRADAGAWHRVMQNRAVGDPRIAVHSTHRGA